VAGNSPCAQLRINALRHFEAKLQNHYIASPIVSGVTSDRSRNSMSQVRNALLRIKGLEFRRALHLQHNCTMWLDLRQKRIPLLNSRKQTATPNHRSGPAPQIVTKIILTWRRFGVRCIPCRWS
jgi:hypothetical protein